MLAEATPPGCESLSGGLAEYDMMCIIWREASREGGSH